MAESEAPRVAFLIIGNEILSGRTRDINLRELALQLRKRGIKLGEAQVVRDEKDAIVAALNRLRARYAAVFTSGGIGPTHDDITTACVAAAFGVEVVRHKQAEDDLRAHYLAQGSEASEARMRMANVPAGAELVYCAQTPAPGFHIGNVYVFAGVPSIFAAMVAAVIPELAGGAALMSRTIVVDCGESQIAPELAAVQDAHPELEIGSYPQAGDGRYWSELVLSGTDATTVADAVDKLIAKLDAKKVAWHEKDPADGA